MYWLGQGVQINQNFAKVIPEDDPEYQIYLKFKQTFGEDGNVMLIGLTGEGLFTPEKLNGLHTLTEDLRKISAVQRVLSVATLPVLRFDTAAHGFMLESLVSQPVTTQAQADSLRELAMHQMFYQDLVFTRDLHTSLVAVTIDRDSLDTNRKVQITAGIKALVDAFGLAHEFDVAYSGLPYIRANSSEKVPREMTLFLVLATVVTMLTLLFFFRSLTSIIFPLILIGISTVWSVGFIGILGYKITLLTALIPPLVVVTGIPNSIYLISTYHNEYRKHGTKYKAILQIISKIGLVTLMINANNAFGYLTLYFTSVVTLQEFGMVAFLSTMGTYLVSIILIPGVFALLPPPTFKNLEHLDNKPIQKIVDLIDRWVVRYRAIIYAVTVACLVGAAFGLGGLEARSYMVDDLPEGDRIYADLHRMEDRFGGAMPLEILVHTDKKKGITRPGALKKMRKLQDRLDTIPEMSRTISVTNVLMAARQAYFGGDSSQYLLPDKDELNFIYPYLESFGAEQSGGSLGINLTDSLNQTARISANIRDVGSQQLPGLLARIQTQIDSVYSPNDSTYTVSITGTTKIFMKANDYLINNLVWSLVATFAIIGLQMFWMFRSIKYTIISIVANLVPLFIIAGLMGYMDVPLKPSTVLIFGIAFGITIDNSIHLLAGYAAARKTGEHIMGAITAALRETGQGMIYTTGVLMMGFMVFMASEFGGTEALGTLTCITMAIAMFSNFFLLPALVVTFERRNIRSQQENEVSKATEEA